MSVDATQYSLKKCISKYLEMEIQDNNIKVLFGIDNRGMNERDIQYFKFPKHCLIVLSEMTLKIFL